MRIVKAMKKEQMDAIYDLYMSAFPANERKPFSLMIEKSREGTMELLSIEDENEEFLGLAIFVIYGDLALLDYFAIAETRRDCGIGSKALWKLQNYYEGKRFCLEIEDASEQTENQEERIRRKAFYLKNGMTIMPFMVDLFGVKMEVLTYKETITWQEYMNLYTSVFTNKVAEKVKVIV